MSVSHSQTPSLAPEEQACHGETLIRTGAFRHHVLVCTFDRPGHCGSFGGLQLLELFRTEVDQRGLAREILVTRTGCTGQHAWGPTVIVYPEGIWYAGVKPEDVLVIIQEHLIEGHPVARLINPRVKVEPHEAEGNNP
jgi:(2Fe-2S) ferredoxin